jgi:hypothetical protein
MLHQIDNALLHKISYLRGNTPISHREELLQEYYIPLCPEWENPFIV